MKMNHNKAIKLGKYSVLFENDSNNMIFFLKDWLMSSPRNLLPDAEIILNSADLTQFMDDYQENGWRLQTKNGIQRVSYFQNGKCAFILEYEADCHKINVLVENNAVMNARIGIQFAILLALHRRCVGLHGVTLLCGNEVIILSAPSGTGKTTLAHLLEQYCDGLVMNGDFALLSAENGNVVFEPTPFCGSSRRCVNHRVKVDRIVFLEQAEKNHWSDLPAREAIRSFLSNAFVPIWNDRLQSIICENAMQMVSGMKMNKFAFAPNREAADLFLNQLQ